MIDLRATYCLPVPWPTFSKIQVHIYSLTYSTIALQLLRDQPIFPPEPHSAAHPLCYPAPSVAPLSLPPTIMPRLLPDGLPIPLDPFLPQPTSHPPPVYNASARSRERAL